jgi:hypothetical protein
MLVSLKIKDKSKKTKGQTLFNVPYFAFGVSLYVHTLNLLM